MSAQQRPIPGLPSVVNLRTSAILLAAGAWDVAATALVVDTAGFEYITVFFSYIRGGAGGAVDFTLEVSPDSTGAVWHQTGLTLGIPVLGADVASIVQRGFYRYGAVGAALEFASLGPINLGYTIARARLIARENGNVGAPGTFAATAVLA